MRQHLVVGFILFASLAFAEQSATHATNAPVSNGGATEASASASASPSPVPGAPASTAKPKPPLAEQSDEDVVKDLAELDEDFIKEFLTDEKGESKSTKKLEEIRDALEKRTDLLKLIQNDDKVPKSVKDFFIQKAGAKANTASPSMTWVAAAGMFAVMSQVTAPTAPAPKPAPAPAAAPASPWWDLRALPGKMVTATGNGIQKISKGIESTKESVTAMYQDSVNKLKTVQTATGIASTVIADKVKSTATSAGNFVVAPLVSTIQAGKAVAKVTGPVIGAVVTVAKNKLESAVNIITGRDEKNEIPVAKIVTKPEEKTEAPKENLVEKHKELIGAVKSGDAWQSRDRAADLVDKLGKDQSKALIAEKSLDPILQAKIEFAFKQRYESEGKSPQELLEARNLESRWDWRKELLSAPGAEALNANRLSTAAALAQDLSPEQRQAILKNGRIFSDNDAIRNGAIASFAAEAPKSRMIAEVGAKLLNEEGLLAKDDRGFMRRQWNNTIGTSEDRTEVFGPDLKSRTIISKDGKVFSYLTEHRDLLSHALAAEKISLQGFRGPSDRTANAFNIAKAEYTAYKNTDGEMKDYQYTPLSGAGKFVFIRQTGSSDHNFNGQTFQKTEAMMWDGFKKELSAPQKFWGIGNEIMAVGTDSRTGTKKGLSLLPFQNSNKGTSFAYNFADIMRSRQDVANTGPLRYELSSPNSEGGYRLNTQGSYLDLGTISNIPSGPRPVGRWEPIQAGNLSTWRYIPDQLPFEGPLPDFGE